MKHIKAIGFDLFNTLITAKPHTLEDAMSRLIGSLKQSGLALDTEPFKQAHREAALSFIKEARSDGRETHNRFWISAALRTLGNNVPPDDPLIASAVDAYFSAFLKSCHLIPGTDEMLGILKGSYRLGLLSNFTHAPAAKKIIDHVGITHFFDVIIISGQVGYRKPHPLVFSLLSERLRMEKNTILFVGDDPEPDIFGAHRAGLQPVWMTYVRDKNIPFLQGYASPEDMGLEITVPRISTWKELFSLLDKE